MMTRHADHSSHHVLVLAATVTLLGAFACDGGNAPLACEPPPIVTVKPGKVVSLAPCFIDPDGDPLSYSVEDLPSRTLALVSVAGDSLTIEGLEEGEFAFTVVATDPDGLSADQMVSVTVMGPTPDLVVPWGWKSKGTVRLFGYLQLRARIYNQGNADAGDTRWKVHVSMDSVITVQDDVFANIQWSVGDVPPGKTTGVIATWVGWRGRLGSWYYGVCAYPSVTDSDESNNCSEEGLKVVTKEAGGHAIHQGGLSGYGATEPITGMDSK